MHRESSVTEQAPLVAAQALLPQIRAAAAEIERQRQLPQALVDAIASAGLFRLTVPRTLGGVETNPETVVRVIEAVAGADGSTAWCLAVALVNGTLAGHFPEDAARAIYGDPAANVAFVLQPAGRAQVVAGGYRVTGRWGFASGCRHATWLGGGAIVHDGKTARLGQDGQREVCYCFFPVAACEIIDTWHVTGLRGTGSHDFAVADVFVPAERTLSAIAGIGLAAVACAAVALGIGRSALDALCALAATKAPQRGGGLPLRDRPLVQHRVGVAEAQLRAARALLLETVRDAWSAARRDDPITPDQRTILGWASGHATAMAVQAVDTAWELAGGSAIFESSPFERRFRDIHMLTQQFLVDATRYGDGGRLFLAAVSRGQGDAQEARRNASAITDAG